MKNFKNMRQQPYIYGFSVKGFFFFSIGLIVSLMIFITGFAFTKFILSGLFIIIFYIIGKFLLSNSALLNKLLDNKLPKKYSDYE
jgi:hypothetical protein